MANSAYLLNTNATKQPVHQVTHGFVAGELVVFNGTDYVRSLADNAVDCEGTVIVSDLNGADDFWISHIGNVGPFTTGSPAVPIPFTPGAPYYVSPTNPGRMTITAPSAPGEQFFPCFLATSTSEGMFFGGFGRSIDATAERTQVITASQTLVSGYTYFVNGGAPLSLPLPANPAIGDQIILDTINANGYVITLSGGQSMITGSGTFTTSVTSTTVGDSLVIKARSTGAGSAWFVENENTGAIAFA